MLETLKNFIKSNDKLIMKDNSIYIKSIFNGYTVIDIIQACTGNTGIRYIYNTINKIYYINNKFYSDTCTADGILSIKETEKALIYKYTVIRNEYLLKLTNDDILKMYNENLHENEKPYNNMLDNVFIKRDYDFIIRDQESTAKRLLIENETLEFNYTYCKFTILDLVKSDDELIKEALNIQNMDKYDKRRMLYKLYLYKVKTEIIDKLMNDLNFKIKYSKHITVYDKLTDLQKYVKDNNIKSFYLTFEDGNILKVTDEWRINNIKYSLAEREYTTDTIHIKEFTTRNNDNLDHNYINVDFLQLKTATFRNKVIMEF